MSKGSGAHRLGDRKSDCLPQLPVLSPPCPGGRPKWEDNRVLRPYLHRSAGCRGDGSRVCRNTGSCQCCFYISAGTGSPGTRPCLEGTGEAGARSPWRCGNMQSFLSHRRLLPHAGPGEAILTRSLCSHPCINSCPPCSAFPPPPLIASPSHLLQSSSSQCGAHTPQGQCDFYGVNLRMSYREFFALLLVPGASYTYVNRYCDIYPCQVFMIMFCNLVILSYHFLLFLF